LTLKAVGKRFGPVAAVEDVNLEVADGEFIVLVGPSGCGKSTLLRVIAGLEEISAGEVQLDGHSLNAVAPRDRDMAMVFQDYALYPHMSVRENMGFALKMRGQPGARIDERVDEVAKILELTSLLERKPRALSGGQRQRVALGRALIRQPEVFLFDEPLSNLDAKLRVGMRMEIRKLQIAFGITSIYVTHDQVEAMTMADRIVVLKSGAVQQIGTPMEIYRNPANSFVGTFIGSPPMSLVSAKAIADSLGTRIDFGKGISARLPAERARALEGLESVVVGLRSEHIDLAAPDRHAENELTFHSDVSLLEDHGADSIAVISLAGTDVLARVSPGSTRVGDPARGFRVDLRQIHLFHPETGAALV
jgi:ABC-type sugar transport system ATPase subunit